MNYFNFVACICMISQSTVFCMIPELLNRDRTRTLPVQMDMISQNSITICTGNKRTLSCREGANIAITEVFWGRLSDQICPSDDGDPVTDCDASPDSLDLVRDECEGKKECGLIAKHSKLQKKGSSHCPGVNKYLIVKFTCMPESKGVLLCDSGESELLCDAGWVMQLADVFWGRRAASRTCGLNEGLECDASESASTYLKKKCNGQHKCLVQNYVDVLDANKVAPCGDAQKYLLLNYICTPPKEANQRPEVVGSDDVHSLKEPSSKELMGILENQVKPMPQAAAFSPAKDKSHLNLSPAPAPAVDTPKKANTSKVEKDEDESLIKKSDLSRQTQTEKSKQTPTLVDDSTIDTTSVRSILSRAKNILKTLDVDPNADVRRKRFRIARPEKSLGRRNKKQYGKRSKIPKRNNIIQNKQNIKRNSVVAPPYYPDNFILKNWYGY